LLILCFLSIFSGWFASDFFIGIGSTAFSHTISVSPFTSQLIESDFLSASVKQLPLLFTLFGLVVSILICTTTPGLFLLTRPSYYYIAMFLNQKWFFDKLYNTVALRFMKNCFYSFYAFLDKGIIEFFGPTGLYRVFWNVSLNLRFYQGGVVSYYFLISLVCLVVFFAGFLVIL
jgi:NADH:ubiquinone oxidoreductase subunit 5 (subunit L)/multisubunit Na+/H+ antiporter MnhA subunit